jgi:eukaryotic-like serine/threonine-protein kinase
MGEVYRARDTRLRRDTALKILPQSFASDPERVARFAREAQVLAALNHPNIATIYGIEEDSLATDSRQRTTALVLEFVEGPTLADTLANGAVPIVDALKIAAQIADALDAAHEKGIVHRDLKPANIKITNDSRVKLLDFGLAKAFGGDSLADAARATTATGMMTRLGVVVGTPAYMSPEQARGLPVDKRTDVWAFGCVLFEMITGREAFPGATISDRVAAILDRDPDWNALPASTPPNVRHLLARCLHKDPKRRWRDIGDVRLELDNGETQSLNETGSRPSSRAGERLAWAALVLLVGAATAFVTAALGRTPAPEVRFDVSFPHDVPSDFVQIALSPDGQQVVAAPSFAARSPLWLRALNSTSGRPLPGTEGATFPFWSPDGESIGFFADGKLKRISVEGQAVEIIAPARNARGGAWQPDGTILFAPEPVGPLFRVPATGGQPLKITNLEPGENDHRAPFLLPDGRHFLYYSRGAPQVRGVHVANLDGSESKRLLDADAAAVYSASGHLLFVRHNELLAQGFDVRRLTTTGDGVSGRQSRCGQSGAQPRVVVGVALGRDRLWQRDVPPHAAHVARSIGKAARDRRTCRPEQPGRPRAFA